jgi:hypothetical protein
MRKHIRKYYPNVDIMADTIFIPYPDLGMKIIDKIKYSIPNNYFSDLPGKADIEAILKADFYKEKGILNLEKKYPVSIYLASGQEDSTINLAITRLQQIYTSFLMGSSPGTVSVDDRIEGSVKYRGYEAHDIKLNDFKEWNVLWNFLRKEGSIYYFPSRINVTNEGMTIRGLIYIFENVDLHFYHFGELILKYGSGKNTDTNATLVLYPFLSRIGVSGFD